MNKKLIPLAVAAAMAAPVAAMADATIYGKLHMSLDYVDVDDNANWVPGKVPAANQGRKVGDSYKGWGLNTTPRSNRVGLKGSEDLGNGLKAIYQVEFGVGLSNEDSSIANGDNGSIKMRNSFIGLAGNWGTIVMGRHDTPLKMATGNLDLFSDTLADYNYTVGFQDLRVDSTVAYISPSFSGLTFAGAVVPSAGSTATGAWNTDADSLAEAWSVALMYKNGPFFASAAYEQLQEEIIPVSGPNADDQNTYKFGLGLMNYSGFTVTGIYEHTDGISGLDDNERDLWQLQAQYAFGNNAIKGMYGQADLDCTLCKDKDTWAIGFDHNFSKRTTAYLLYTSLNDDVDDADWSGFSLGMIHNF